MIPLSLLAGPHAACRTVRCYECVLIEQGIARGDSAPRIAHAADTTIERVAEVRELMEHTATH